MPRTGFTVGVDYGTNSVRAIVVDCTDGRVLGTHVFDYPSGDHGVLLDPKQPHLARQNPADYIAGLRASVLGALGGSGTRRAFFTRSRHRYRRRHDRLDAASARRERAPAFARSASSRTTWRRTRGSGRTTPPPRGCGDHGDRRPTRSGTARANRRHLFVRVVVVENLALPEGGAGGLRRRGDLGGAGGFHSGVARRRRAIRATSSAASVPPATRRCTPTPGADFRRRPFSRASTRSSPSCATGSMTRPGRRAVPRGSFRAEWAATFGLPPASRSRWAASTRTTARSVLASRPARS